MPEPTIPDEARERAARALAQRAVEASRSASDLMDADEAAAAWNRLGDTARDDFRDDARAALAAAVPLCIAAFVDDLIADPDNYTAGGAFRPIVLAHARAALRSSVAAQTPKET